MESPETEEDEDENQQMVPAPSSAKVPSSRHPLPPFRPHVEYRNRTRWSKPGASSMPPSLDAVLDKCRRRQLQLRKAQEFARTRRRDRDAQEVKRQEQAAAKVIQRFYLDASYGRRLRAVHVIEDVLQAVHRMKLGRFLMSQIQTVVRWKRMEHEIYLRARTSAVIKNFAEAIVAGVLRVGLDARVLTLATQASIIIQSRTRGWLARSHFPMFRKALILTADILFELLWGRDRLRRLARALRLHKLYQATARRRIKIQKVVRKPRWKRKVRGVLRSVAHANQALGLAKKPPYGGGGSGASTPGTPHRSNSITPRTPPGPGPGPEVYSAIAELTSSGRLRAPGLASFRRRSSSTLAAVSESDTSAEAASARRSDSVTPRVGPRLSVVPFNEENAERLELQALLGGRPGRAAGAQGLQEARRRSVLKLQGVFALKRHLQPPDQGTGAASDHGFGRPPESATTAGEREVEGGKAGDRRPSGVTTMRLPEDPKERQKLIEQFHQHREQRMAMETTLRLQRALLKVEARRLQLKKELKEKRMTEEAKEREKHEAQERKAKEKIEKARLLQEIRAKQMEQEEVKRKALAEERFRNREKVMQEQQAKEQREAKEREDKRRQWLEEQAEWQAEKRQRFVEHRAEAEKAAEEEQRRRAEEEAARKEEEHRKLLKSLKEHAQRLKVVERILAAKRREEAQKQREAVERQAMRVEDLQAKAMRTFWRAHPDGVLRPRKSGVKEERHLPSATSRMKHLDLGWRITHVATPVGDADDLEPPATPDNGPHTTPSVHGNDEQGQLSMRGGPEVGVMDRHFAASEGDTLSMKDDQDATPYMERHKQR